MLENIIAEPRKRKIKESISKVTDPDYTVDFDSVNDGKYKSKVTDDGRIEFYR